MRIHLTIPVHNEERALGKSLGRVVEFLEAREVEDRRAWETVGLDPKDFFWEAVIAENGSTDRTWEVVQQEVGRWKGAAPHVEVKGMRREQPGRGGALQEAWLGTEADIVSYMDVDLSSDLRDYPRLLAPLVRDEADLAVGSRLAQGAEVQRGWKREVLSRGYSVLVRIMLRFPVRDAQCGFKAMKAAAAPAVLLEVEDRGWFWDTELLWVANWKGFRVREIPIRWVEDRDSRVRLLPAIWGDLRGLWRLWRRGRRSGAASLPQGRGIGWTKR